jgi:hypothetical protein
MLVAAACSNFAEEDAPHRVDPAPKPGSYDYLIESWKAKEE